MIKANLREQKIRASQNLKDPVSHPSAARGQSQDLFPMRVDLFCVNRATNEFL
jgi:hypothetical protein